jgi:hypothetical protein
MAWDTRIPMLGQQFDTNQVLGAVEQGQKMAGLAQKMGIERDTHQISLAELANKQAKQAQLGGMLGRGASLQDLVRGGFIDQAKDIAGVQHQQAQTDKTRGDVAEGLRKEQEQMRAHVATNMSGATRENWSAQADATAAEIQNEILSSGGAPETAQAYAQQIRAGLGEWSPEKQRIYKNQVVSPQSQFGASETRKNAATQRAWQAGENRKNREAAQGRAETMAGQKKEATNSELDRKRQEGIPAAWVATKDLTAEQKNAFNEVDRAGTKINSTAKQLVEFLDNNQGGTFIKGTDQDKLNRLRSQLVIHQKTLDNMGASFTDMERALVDAVVGPDPTKALNVLWDQFGGDRIRAGVDGLIESTNLAVTDEAERIGLQKKAKRTGVSGMNLTGKVKVSNGEESFEVDAADLDNVRADGFEVAQ